MRKKCVFLLLLLAQKVCIPPPPPCAKSVYSSSSFLRKKCVFLLLEGLGTRLTIYMMLHFFISDGSVDFSALLDLLNQSSQTAVRVKAEVFQTILRIFQLDSAQKGIFRDVCGFHYLISVLASLIGSLAPRRTDPWIGGM